MIKYLGSKRLLVPVLGTIADAVTADSAVDLFTGTTRVAQEFKRRGLNVTTVDTATYSDILARCFIATDAGSVDTLALSHALADLNALPGRPGYFTSTFCEDSRYFQPKNGARIDAIREELRTSYRDDPLFPVLLTSLMLAADRVDSTTGLQMAYLKQWSPRAHKDLELRSPLLLPGTGRSILGDALQVVDELPPTDLAYLDPPYNQHRYFTNYHVWETLVRWDQPDHYGIACKRADSRDPATKSAFNGRRTMPSALVALLGRVRAEVTVVSYNNESWLTQEEIERALLDSGRERVALLAFGSPRYVGAQIGIHSPAGVRVGEVSHLRNVEFVFVAGPAEKVDAAVAAVQESRPPQLLAGAPSA